MTATRQHIKWFLAAELLAFLLVAVVTCCCMPLAQAARMTIALAVAYALPCWFYHRGDHATPLGHGVLLVAALWLAAIAIPFVWRCTIGSGASFTMPQLIGDANDYYNWALAQYDGSSVKPKVTFWGYSILIVALWKVLGVNVIWPVVMNVMATLFTIVLAGRLAARIDFERRERVATLAMAFLVLMGFFMSQGAQMLKEPWVYLAMTLIAYGMMPASPPPAPLKVRPPKSPLKRGTYRDADTLHSPLFRGGWGGRYALVYALGCLILAAVRAKYINFLFIGLFLMMVAGLRSPQAPLKGGVQGASRTMRLSLLFVITLFFWWLGMKMTDHYTIIQQVNNVTGEGGMATLFAPEGVFQRIIGDYFQYPVWKKLLYLPATCGVQWVIPFPWMPEGEQASWLGMAPRLRLGWYVLSGVVLYFYLFRSWRRGWQWAVWAWFPMLCYVGIAYMTAGTVSRYLLAFQPWWMALSALTLLTCWRLRSFRLFMLVYLFAFAAILITCFIIT